MKLESARAAPRPETKSRFPAQRNGEGTDVTEVPWVLCIDDDADFSDAMIFEANFQGV